MRSQIMLAASLFVAGASAAPFALADPPADKCDPTCTDIKVSNIRFADGGTQLIVTGHLECVTEDVTIETLARGMADVKCVNPGGNEPAPKQPEPVDFTVKGSTLIKASELKKGCTDFTVTTQEPVVGSLCPAGWNQEITDVSFASVYVFLPTGDLFCVFFDGTSDGPIIPGTYECEG